MSTVFNHKWQCLKHRGCLFSVPCDCENCKLFEKILENNTYKAKAKNKQAINPHQIYPDRKPYH